MESGSELQGIEKDSKEENRTETVSNNRIEAILTNHPDKVLASLCGAAETKYDNLQNSWNEQWPLVLKSVQDLEFVPEDVIQAARAEAESNQAEVRKEALRVKDTFIGKLANSKTARALILSGSLLGSLESGVGAGSGNEEQRVAGYEQIDRKHETFEEMKERAKRELAEQGITSEQKMAHRPINDIIYRVVDPVASGYYFEKDGSFLVDGNSKEFVVDAVKKIFSPEFREKRALDIEKEVAVGSGSWTKEKDLAQEEDAWRLYLGIPQKNGTFEVSDYMPSKSTETKYYFKKKRFWNDQAVERGGGQQMIEEILKEIHTREQERKTDPSRNFRFTWHEMVMGNFTFSQGEDERGTYISYYDRWNLDKVPLEGKGGFFGKPFEIYDRLYYDPQTFQPLEAIHTFQSGAELQSDTQEGQEHNFVLKKMVRSSSKEGLLELRDSVNSSQQLRTLAVERLKELEEESTTKK